MSFTLVEQARPRLHRSELAVPGSNPSLFEKAAKSKADIVFLDLEDAVAPDEKEQARRNVIAALNDIDWGEKTLMLRINGLDTYYMYRDVVDPTGYDSHPEGRCGERRLRTRHAREPD
jgi:malyl-CoA/(S)-citramalyl-CoA lyase